MSIAGSVSFGGLGSGTDFNEMISQLKVAELYYATTLEKRQDKYDTQIKALDGLLDLLNELEDSTAKFADPSAFIKSLAESSNSSALSATADANAPASNNTVHVKQLATASIQSYAELFTKDENGNFEALTTDDGQPATFSYMMGDEEVTVELRDGDTIEDLVKAINSDADNPGVKASLISSGNGYVFQVQSTKTGKDNEVTLTGSNIMASDGNGGTQKMVDSSDTTSGWHKLEAQDAEFYLNGFEAQVLTSSTNSISGVIEGVTFDLKQVTDEPITITVKEDHSGIQESVEEWVGSVNKIFTMLQELTKVSEQSVSVSTNTDESTTVDLGSTFTGNSTIRMFQQRLKGLVSGSAAGLTAGEDSYSMLSMIGIKTNATQGTDYGLLTIDYEQLSAAISKNPQGVTDLFSASGGTTNSSNFKFQESVVGNAKAGEYEVKYDLTNGTSGTVIADSVTIGGYKATYSAESGLYTVTDKDSPAYGLSLSFANGELTKPTDDDGKPVTEKIYIQEGKADALVSFLKEETRFVEGYESLSPLATMKNNLKTQSDALYDKIEKEIDRVDAWEVREKAKYARLEVYMSQMNNQMSSIASAMGGLQSW